MSTTTCLGHWLAWLGIGERELANRISVAPATVNAAIRRGSTKLPWLEDAARLLAVPSDILLTAPPDSAAARPYGGRALIHAARRRLRERGKSLSSAPVRGAAVLSAMRPTAARARSGDGSAAGSGHGIALPVAPRHDVSAKTGGNCQPAAGAANNQRREPAPAIGAGG